ncbi:MAG: fatty acid CoA ligase family protein [Verrucomicrobiota bacterium]
MNIADHLTDSAEQFPCRAAIAHATGRQRAGRDCYTQLTFSGLNQLCNAYAAYLHDCGLRPGMRALLMVRPGPDFAALVFALFRMGALPVLIDPGMGLRGFLRCVRTVEPQGFLGVPAAQAIRRAFPAPFRSVTVSATPSQALARRMSESAQNAVAEAFPPRNVDADDPAAILFTTGSTGPAKGVEYSVRTFQTQISILRDRYGVGPGDIDLPCFPLFGLFSLALGASIIIPHMDPTRPADVDPRRIIGAVRDHGATISFGSPALWRTVSSHCVEHGVQLPSLRRIFMAGAPVPAWLHRRMLEQVLAPGAEIHTPYGATESLPISSISGAEVLNQTAARTDAGEGICVGRPVSEADVRIIRIDERAIETWTDDLELERGEVGEITVAGPMVTQRYYGLPEKTRLAKIRQADGTVRHRVGDLGYVDEDGLLWVCGRKAHLVTTPNGPLYTVCCEAIINQHPDVYRSALVGVGPPERQVPVMIIEAETGKHPQTRRQRASFREQLRKIAKSAEQTRDLEHFLFRSRLPTDIRHNSKIGREILRTWAERKLKTARSRLP